MKNCVKVVVLFLLLLTMLISCKDNPTKSSKVEVNTLLEIHLEEMYQNNLEPDSLLVYLTGEDVDYTHTFTDLESFMKLEFIFSSNLPKTVLMEASLYYGESVKTAYSQYFVTEDNNNTIIGELRANYYHQNVILKLDTNPATDIAVSELYNYTVLNKFFKEFKIENVAALGDEFCNTPMKFMLEHGINYTILDENMISLVPYPFGDYYNPVTTCNNAFGCYDQYLKTNDGKYLEWFYANADWVMNYRDSDSLLRYEFMFNHESATLPIGWTSAMAQGQALALMCIAYHNSGDDKYLQAAHGFFTTMHTNVGTAWNVYIDGEDYLWYEEYPSEDFCHVLNGKLFGMWGLWEYYCITLDNDALRLLQGGIATVVDNYPLWDIDGQDGSHYCCHTTIYSDYHHIHKNQMVAFRDMFHINEFDIILKTFTNQRKE